MLIYIGGSLSGYITSRCIMFSGCCGIGGGCLGGRRGACGEVGSGFALALSGLWGGGGDGELVACIKGRELRARVHFAFRGLSCWEASVTLYLWFQF